MEIDSICIPLNRKFWWELNWLQPARTKILVDFNLVDGRVRSSHSPNLIPAHALEMGEWLARPVQFDRAIWSVAYKGIFF